MPAPPSLVERQDDEREAAMAALQDDLGLPYPAADGKASGSPVAERPRLLCLHSSGGSSEILRRQLQCGA